MVHKQVDKTHQSRSHLQCYGMVRICDGEGKNEPDHCNMSVLQLALQFLRRTNGIIINVCSSEFLLLTWTGGLHCGWKGGTAA